jgi:transposase-like protein
VAPSKLARTRRRQHDSSTRVARPSGRRNLRAMRVGGEGSSSLSVETRAELARLRVENSQLRAERDLLANAASRFIARTACVLGRSGANQATQEVTTPSAVEDVTVWVRGLA